MAGNNGGAPHVSHARPITKRMTEDDPGPKHARFAKVQLKPPDRWAGDVTDDVYDATQLKMVT